MSELPAKPLLVKARATIVWPALLAILGMLIATAAAVTGQDERRARDTLQLNFDRLYWEKELDLARHAGKPAEEIGKIEAIVREKQEAGIAGYAEFGRQFTSWDGYRYEEIMTAGYLYHMPGDSQEVKESSVIKREGWTERRLKNVVWYPLYPVVGWVVAKGLGVAPHVALTVVSWVSCLLAAVVLFVFARRHYAGRPGVFGELEGRDAAEAGDTAALWAVAGLLFGPCSIFLYANFTESLFVLLLVAFLYCLQSGWWWRAAMVAGVASACRSQGVLFGPILALVYLLRVDGGGLRGIFRGNLGKKLGVAVALGVISGVGIGLYMVYLQVTFGDGLAFMHAQKYWNVGVGKEQILYAMNPMNALGRIRDYAFFGGPVDWPRLWEAICLVWPPVVLMLGRRYLSFELGLMGWILWGLPYVSNSRAGNPPMDTQWMSMGRFMAVMVPAYVILGVVLARRPRLGVLFLAGWAAAFGIFAMKYGNGAWVG